MANQKPPWVATRIVKASRHLTPVEKLIWIEDYVLDSKGDGAYISATSLADRLGISASAVNHGRARLRAVGLHDSKRNGKGMVWYATIPRACLPKNDRDADDILRATHQLDYRIEEHETLTNEARS